jgi:transposase
MIGEPSPREVRLACGATDLRKSIDGLAALVQLTFELDPFSESWFVFCNKDRNKLKLLRWDHNGFWLYYRRLERGRFQWPRSADAPTKAITHRQLLWLLDGLNLEQKRAHRPVEVRRIA